MHDIDLRLTVSAAIRAQGRLSAHPDDIRAAQAEADGIIGYLVERDWFFGQRDAPCNEPAAACDSVTASNSRRGR